MSGRSAAADLAGGHDAVRAHADARDLEALALQRAAGLEHRRVLDRGGDDVPAARGRPPAPAPRTARLFDSVAPEVNTMSSGRAPISAATCARASSTAACASWPKACCRLEGLPNFSVKYGSIAASTAGSTGVVAWWSR